jgi:hypothetical protein
MQHSSNQGDQPIMWKEYVSGVLEWKRIIREAFTDKFFLLWFIPLAVMSLLMIAILMDLLSYDHVFKGAHLASEACRNLSDKEAFVMLMNMLITALSGLVSIGELIRFAENKKRGIPVQYGSFITSTSIAAISLISLLIFSRYFCH